MGARVFDFSRRNCVSFVVVVFLNDKMERRALPLEYERKQSSSKLRSFMNEKRRK
jgi:hypothetical protein